MAPVAPSKSRLSCPDGHAGRSPASLIFGPGDDGGVQIVSGILPEFGHAGMHVADLQTMEQREALRQETTKVIRETLEKMEGKNEHPASGGGGHGDEHKAEGHSEEGGKVEHTEGFKEAYFTEFLVD